MKVYRTYVDTSVFGGVFDDEFKFASQEFFEQANRSRFQIVISAAIKAEIVLAPEAVKEFFFELIPRADLVEISEPCLKLRDSYLKAKIVTKKFSTDALHVAIATVSQCDLIVSWNFQHIVHFDKIPLYNAVNILEGFQQLAIHSPLEVIKYE